MLKLAFLILSLPFLAHGGEGLYYAARNRQLTTLTCDQFAREPPRARWLRVTGCQIDYMHPAVRESGGAVGELFFPMQRQLQAPEPVLLVVATRDPQALAIAQDILGGGQPADEETFTVGMLRVVGVLRASREVEGYARTGLVERFLTRRALADSAPLAPGALILDLHARPSYVQPAIEAAAGFVLLLIPAAVSARRKRAVAVPPKAPTPALPVVRERRIPTAMLLNLDASASASEIEFAPALGTRQDVLVRIAAVLGPLSDEGGGRHTARGEDWALEFDLGDGNEVATATVDARGSDAALDALEKLSTETGWRVFVPRLGTFGVRSRSSIFSESAYKNKMTNM